MLIEKIENKIRKIANLSCMMTKRVVFYLDEIEGYLFGY
jgi:hypothetical protein